MSMDGCCTRVRWRCWSGPWRSSSCFAAITGRSESTPAAPSATILCREIIARYRHDFPDLPVELSVGNSLDVINAVADLRVDFGLIEGPCHAADIIAEPWLEG